MIRVGTETPDYEPEAKVNYDRTKTEMLSDLHVLVIPLETWKREQKNSVEEILSDAQSAGYIRVNAQSTLRGLRGEISHQLGSETIPRDFSFLRPIGRYFTQVNAKQEQELKAKYFLPPQSFAPELYVLDSTAEAPSPDRTHDDLNRHTVLPSIGTVMPDYDDTGIYDYDNDEYDDDNRYNNDTQRTQGPTGREMTEIEQKKRLKALEEEEEVLRQKQQEEEEKRRRKIAERVQTPSPFRRQTSSENDAEFLRIQREMEKLRDRRQDIEKMKEKLSRHAKSLQQDYLHKRHDARDAWKKKYFEEKKKTLPKEDLFADLREKLHDCHRKELLRLETGKEAAREAVKRGEVDRDIIDKANLKIHTTRLKDDIEELSTQLQNTKMRLTAEMKLRNQSENELRTMRKDRAMYMNNIHAKDDFMPTNRNHTHHHHHQSPRRDKHYKMEWIDDHNHRAEKKSTFAVREHPPRYRDDLNDEVDEHVNGIILPREQPEIIHKPHPPVSCRHCGTNRRSDDEVYPAKVHHDELNILYIEDHPTEKHHNVCLTCRFSEDKKELGHRRPRNDRRHTFGGNCQACRRKGHRKNRDKKCHCSAPTESERRAHKLDKEIRKSRKHCDHCDKASTNSSTSSSDSEDSSSSSSSSSDSDSSSSSHSSNDEHKREKKSQKKLRHRSSSSHSSDDEQNKKKKSQKKPRHRKDCSCRRNHRHGKRLRVKKHHQSDSPNRKREPEIHAFEAKPPEVERISNHKRDQTPEKFAMREIEERQPEIEEIEQPDQKEKVEPELEIEEPKPVARKIKNMSKSPKAAKKPLKNGAMNNPRGRPYRPGDLEDAFKTFASKADGKEATNGDIVKWCTDADILGKNLTSQHVDISFSKIKAKGSKTIARKDLQPLIEHLAYKYKEDKKSVDVQEAKREISEKLANAPFMLHRTTNAAKTGAVQRLTDASKFTGMHKTRFDETGKGKGNGDLTVFGGYVTNYKMAGTYDDRH